MTETDLAPHQIFVLQLLSQPARVQLEEFRYDCDNVAVGLAYYWDVVFKKWGYLNNNKPLDYLPEDVFTLDAMLNSLPDSQWTHDALVSSPEWEKIRDASALVLKRRNIPTTKPDQDDWYQVLPDHLHHLTY